MVQIREPCGACDGSGTRRERAGAGHVRWARRVPCEDCDGSGLRLRWITLDELRGLLERRAG
jgi:DnaJ-class molecular chaperone